jgi:peptidoglycan hydrolase CwlO-like protein
VVVGLVALLAAGAAGYAISEIESAKDENREDDQAVSALREDLEVLREQTGERSDALEGRLDDAASAQEQQKLQDDLEALQKRVTKLDQQDDGAENDELTTRVDDLEQRVEDLENDSN